MGFLPINLKEAKERGFDTLDFVIITGDAYVDHPSFGTAIISRVLEAEGYSVGIIAQPNFKNTDDIARFGAPRLAFLINAGNIDSMVAHYTAAKRKRSDDAYSPGNKAGGITTLEEKSLGCVQKGGLSTVVDVLDYGDSVSKNGLSLLNGPGNDIVAVTNLMAAGVHLILFTTGRGTPLGSAVPTVKISTNKNLAERKKNWIDFDASLLIENKTMDELTEELLEYILKVASGKETQNEINDYREISIFKDGVTL